MIHAKTWIPGTERELDNLFESLRHNFYASQKHDLWKNYDEHHFKNCSALTISFEDDHPIFCSSILQRKIWPTGVYRIMNRYWRIGNDHTFLKTISPGSGAMTKSQIEWAEKQPNFKLAFISRQYDHWQKFIINEFNENYQIDFKSDNYYYCTCETSNDNSCWQRIIYYGDSCVLDSWNRR